MSPGLRTKHNFSAGRIQGFQNHSPKEAQWMSKGRYCARMTQGNQGEVAEPNRKHLFPPPTAAEFSLEYFSLH